MKQYRYNPRVGDIITTSGTGFVSGVINVCTFGVPYWHASHVGIVTEVDKRRLVIESTSVVAQPCEVARVPVQGVQLHTLDDVVARPGRAWVHRIARPLYSHEAQRLQLYLLSRLGTPYDLRGAIRAGGLLFSAVQSVLRHEDLVTLFCSELVASGLDHIGYFPVHNASGWSPNKLVRALVRAGLYQDRFQLHPGMFPPSTRSRGVSTKRRL